MPKNRRIFYAVKAVGLSPKDSPSYTVIHGLQSVNITTTFNLEQVFEIGQISIYENIENIPDVEVSLQKVLDGYPLIYHLATRNPPSQTLVGRSNQKCNLAMSIFGDTSDSASGTPITELNVSGLFVSSLTYTMPVDGNCTEDVTLVGNNKLWKSSGFTFSGSLFNNLDEPLALTSGLGGVQRRENVKFASLINGTVTLLPSGAGGIPGISSSGTNDKDSEGDFGAHIQGITISADLGREAINELGRKGPYHRFATFPVEVTCEIEIIATSGDLVSATEAGVAGGGNNLFNQRILVVLDDSTKFDLGTKNKLSNVSFGGGDAGGGNDTVTFSYTTFNDLTISQDQNPN